MRNAVGGVMDLKAMSRMHFHVMEQAQQVAAIRRLAASGQSEHTISHATGWSIEAIRRVLTPEAT